MSTGESQRDALLSAVKEGGKIIRAQFRSTGVNHSRKSSISDYVTNVDVQVEKRVRGS